MSLEATSRPAIVVGGAFGIGAAVSAQHRAARDPVVVWDLAGDFDIECDIADPDQIDAALARTIEQIGVPARLTVCAGVGHSGLLRDIAVEEWDRVFNVNTRGPWLVMRAVATAMADFGGSIVTVSSVSARIADRNTGAYCASKAALSMLIEVAACEWGGDNIRVNGVAPGVTNTRMLGNSPRDSGWLPKVIERTALQRLGEPQDIADAIFALHDLGWVTGQILDCDGGLSRHSPIDSYGEMLNTRRRGLAAPSDRTGVEGASPRAAEHDTAP